MGISRLVGGVCAVLWLLLPIGVSAKADEGCSDFMTEQPRPLSVECLNEAVIFVASLPNAAAIIQDPKENIYVQILSFEGDFTAEAVGRRYYSGLKAETTKNLLEMGWKFPTDGNFTVEYSEDFIVSGKAAQHLLLALRAYGKDLNQPVKVTILIPDLKKRGS